MNSSMNFEDFVATSPLGIIKLDVAKTRALVDDRRSNGRDTFYTCDQVCALTNSATILSANHAALEMLSIQGQEPPYRIAAIVPEAMQRPFAEGLTSFFSGETRFRLVGTLNTASGTHFPAIINAWVEGTDSPASRVWICITKAESSQTESESKSALLGDLAHVARVALLGEMTASISHEVNQPLSSIVTSAEAGLRWLNHEQPDLAEVRAVLERIVRSGQRAGNIISTLKGMARNTRPERSAASLAAIVDEAVLILRPDLTRCQVGLKIEVTPNLPSVLVDRTQILQVLVNLATNAAQAMADGQAWNRTLAIRAKRNGADNVTIEVEDSGPGVDPAVRERLFESFYTTKTSGMGMGLAICRSIVEAHNSTIELESSLYLGARFSFTLEAFRPELTVILQESLNVACRS